MTADPPEPPKRSRGRLLMVRGIILALGAWAIFMGWQMAQLPPDRTAPEAAAPAP